MKSDLHQDFSIHPHHLTEWRESSVDDRLTALNLLSLSSTEPKNHLFAFLPNSERRNDGRVRDKWLHRYAHTEAGGYWISGLDPHNNWQKWDYGRFKPDRPRIDEKGKPIKYESPPKSESHPTYFDVPTHIWDKVAKRYRIKRYRSPLSLRLADKLPPKRSSGYSLTSIGQKRSLSDCLKVGVKPAAFLPPNLQSPSEPNLEPTDNYCFWSWVAKHPEIPIILTEGEKKTACLLSLGFVAIASRVHIKQILNLTIPKNCKPMWLVGVLIGQLGLKTVSCKKGKRGEQVRYYSLAKSDTIFALEVLQHRIKQREEKAIKELATQQNNKEHQARMQAQYGIEPPLKLVDTPPDKEGIYTLEGGMDTDENWIENSKNTIERLNSELKRKLKQYLAILRGDDLDN